MGTGGALMIYEDVGVWREIPAATRSALLAAMGVNPAQSGPPPESPVRVLRPGQALPLDKPAELRLRTALCCAWTRPCRPTCPSATTSCAPWMEGHLSASS
jgi:hypothetical protein